MRPRKSSILSDLTLLPWWYSPIAALLMYLLVGYLIPSLLFERRPVLAGVSEALLQLAPIVGLLFLLPMPFAYFNGRKKRRLVETADDLASIRQLSWRQFEQLIAEVYRRKGYRVRENVTSGPDGGVDVTLEKDGELHLVQCKQWKAQKVGVTVIREMYGLMAAHQAASVSVVTSGMFTQEAQSFAEGKSIDLINGANLAPMVASVRVSQSSGPRSALSVPAAKSDLCPKCGKPLVQRLARRGVNAGNKFMGCCAFPKCRYTRDV